ncbi:MAG: glyoxalase superfamily protein [Alphaproteobacteria bacterium]
MSTFGHATPILRSFDEAAARAFYLDFLGFTVEFEHRFAPDLPLYMAIRLGDCAIHLSEHYGDASPGARLRIPTADVAALAETLAARRSRHARPGAPVAQPWGDLELTLADPFGNRLTFFTPGAAESAVT